MTVIEPIAFRVVIKPDPVKEKTQGGIIIQADKKAEKAATVSGTIVALGPDVYAAFKPTFYLGGLKIGDHVLFAKYAGKGTYDPQTNEFLIIVNDEDVVAKVPAEVSEVIDVNTIVAS